MRRIVSVVAALFVLVLFAFGPGIVRKPMTLAHVEAVRGEPSTQITTSNFELKEYSKEFTISIRSGIEQADFLVQLFDGSGKMLVQMNFRPQYNNSFPFSIGDGFAPGRYRLRVVEQGVVGKYSVSLYQGTLPSTSPSQLLLVTLALAISGGYYGYALRRSGGDSRAPSVLKARYVLGCVLFAFIMTIAYPLIHETGHAIVLAHYGRFDLHCTDFIGLWGTPHAGRTPGPSLGGWGEAIMSISGPMLPNLVGYLMFGFGLSPFGRRWLARSSARDVFWSGMTACMLFAHIFAFVPMTGLVSDGDYTGYISNIPIPHWQANGLLLLFSVVNAAIVLTLIKHLIRKYLRETSARH